MQQYPNYVCRVTADEGDIGLAHLADFQDVDKTTPVILTTSQLLTTGVDAPTCKNVVLARVIGSMREFRQIIRRGTRVRVGRPCTFTAHAPQWPAGAAPGPGLVPRGR